MQGLDALVPEGNSAAVCSKAVVALGNNAKQHGCGAGLTFPVVSLKNGASPYGVHDMAGNVWEWTAHPFDPTYYAVSPKTDPKGWSKGWGVAIRGGSKAWKSPDVRASERHGFDQSYASDQSGFRCARSAPK